MPELNNEADQWLIRLDSFKKALGWSVLAYLAILIAAYLFLMLVKSGTLSWPLWARPDHLDIWWYLVGLAEKLGWLLISVWILCFLWVKNLKAALTPRKH